MGTDNSERSAPTPWTQVGGPDLFRDRAQGPRTHFSTRRHAHQSRDWGTGAARASGRERGRRRLDRNPAGGTTGAGLAPPQRPLPPPGKRVPSRSPRAASSSYPAPRLPIPRRRNGGPGACAGRSCAVASIRSPSVEPVAPDLGLDRFAFLAPRPSRTALKRAGSHRQDAEQVSARRSRPSSEAPQTRQTRLIPRRPKGTTRVSAISSNAELVVSGTAQAGRSCSQINRSLRANPSRGGDAKPGISPETARLPTLLKRRGPP